jgi:hypothetical protein
MRWNDWSRSSECAPHREAKQRLEAALQGAFKTSPTPMKDIPPKRKAKQRVLRKKT